eukprot:scaffold34_cov260-Pinguiococcus_pyrenoidosus.AAC.35
MPPQEVDSVLAIVGAAHLPGIRECFALPGKGKWYVLGRGCCVACRSCDAVFPSQEPRGTDYGRRQAIS